MRRLPLAAVLLFVTSALPAQTLGPVDWIFLVDTSKSMRGAGGTKDIWLDVQASLNAFLRQAGPEDTVTMYGFDRDVREIQAPPNGDLYRAILDLKADGNRTHLGAAIAKGLGRAEQLRSTSGEATRRQVVVLFTDGKEDVRGIQNPVPIDSTIDRVGETFIYFVSMGEHEPQLDAFAAKAERAEVMRAPTAEAIRDVAREIRAKIPPKEQPVTPKAAPRPPPPPPAPAPKPSLLSTLLKLAIALALLVAIAALILQQHRKKNRLEGELEILRPRAAPDTTFVGLPKLAVSEIALSAILPVEALAGSDARLFVRRSGSCKKVWIAARSGSLRINEVETPMSELYDADTIEIGDVKVRFNRVGDERPLESNQEGEL